jgi:hypothetical protein
VDDLKKIISVYSITKKMSTRALYLLEDHENSTKESVAHAVHIEKDLFERGIYLEEQ